ncbi:MAG TPA: PIN domain-containing protein [Allosphingosinicella sp.]|nr:PIN domain-containing protein [Allosphingosinicella sp.]
MVPVVVLDANVLFPMILRDTLLRTAAAGCFRAHWSVRILDEMARNLIEQHRITSEQAKRLVAQMGKAFPEAAVEGWEDLEEAMPNDPKDRHVAAAAATIDAAVVVTENLKDFMHLPMGIQAVMPDTFLLERFQKMPEEVLSALRKQASSYRKPPATFEDLLDWLASDLPTFVDAVRMDIAKRGTT